MSHHTDACRIHPKSKMMSHHKDACRMMRYLMMPGAAVDLQSVFPSRPGLGSPSQGDFSICKCVGKFAVQSMGDDSVVPRCEIARGQFDDQSVWEMLLLDIV